MKDGGDTKRNWDSGVMYNKAQNDHCTRPKSDDVLKRHTRHFWL